jgi:hypothetical protein
VLHLRKLNQPFSWNTREEAGEEGGEGADRQDGNATDYVAVTCR